MRLKLLTGLFLLLSLVWTCEARKLHRRISGHGSRTHFMRHERHRTHHHRKMMRDSPMQPPESGEVTTETPVPVKPKIYQLLVKSEITSRFATTLVVSRLANKENVSCEAVFTIRLPEAAFISNFSMEIKQNIIVGNVKEKEKAKRAYEVAKASGQSAGQVAQKPRETNSFQISVNVGPHEKVSFNLTYQEILTRVHGLYKHVINIQPGQVVPKLRTDIYLNEDAEIVKLHVPEIKKKIGEKENKDLEQQKQSQKVQIEREISAERSTVHISYAPSEADQAKDSLEGIDGQMVVLYDVKRDFDGGEIKVVDGYFVHFFAPAVTAVGPKHVIFVLDKSGSMQGAKIQQTKDAMRGILGDLNEGDYFNVLKFSDSAEQWKPESVLASPQTIASAIEYVDDIKAFGGTNIDAALKESLALIAGAETPTLGKMIIFLTDGQPTVGITGNAEIVSNVEEGNTNTTVAIHSIGFGQDSDFTLLKQISISNKGLARKVYEDSDASLQLQGFYAQISGLLLKDISISYLNNSVDPDTLIKDESYDYYEGGEVVVFGKVNPHLQATSTVSSEDEDSEEDIEGAVKVPQLSATVSGVGITGAERFRVICSLPPPIIGRVHPFDPAPENPTPAPAHTVAGFVERMWAYKSIQKLLDQAKYLETNETVKETLKKKALSLSLKYNFVTELTSMLVVQDKQNTSMKVEEEKGDVIEGRVMNYAKAIHSSLPKPLRRNAVHGSHSSWRMGVPQASKSKPVDTKDKSASKLKVTKKPKPDVVLPKCEGDHEVLLTKCGEHCRQQTCDTYGKFVPCTLDCKRPMCGCEPGFVRHKKSCIRPTKCPQLQCSANETLAMGCFPDCDNRCEKPQHIFGPRCPMLCDSVQCNCKEGYTRNDKGHCISPVDCPGAVNSCDDPNASLEVCPRECFTDTNCDNYATRKLMTCRIAEGICSKPECLCNSGYIHGPDGKCIKPEKCPQYSCGQNEMLNSCGNLCEKSCKSAFQTKPCSAVCHPPACTCIQGFFRHNGLCVNITQCPEVCGKNEEYASCGSHCELTCQTSQNSEPCMAVCGPPGCTCAQGFIRDEVTKKCVPQDQCPKQLPSELVCGPNETMNSCGNKCEKRCDNQDPICPMICAPPACECKEGLFRKGKDCVPLEQCTSHAVPRVSDPIELECGANEEVNSCGNRCEATCENKDSMPPCPLVCDPPACQCKEGFYRDGENCVPAEECVSTTSIPGLECGANEEVNSCGNRCELTCATKDTSPPCPLICDPPACQCKPGFYRHEGNCVPAETCLATTVAPDLKCGANEEVNSCGNRCELTCATKDTSPPCPLICDPPACQCKPGFFRHEGNCVPAGNCPSTPAAPGLECGVNEEINSCGNRCELTCATKDTSPPCPLICDPPACQCKPGFFRHEGNCVPAETCPATTVAPDLKCAANEEVNSCGNRCELTCATKDTSPPCPLICDPPACQCKPGFYRHEGNCVPAENCPSTPVIRRKPNLKCKQNEQINICGNHCEKTCENGDKLMPCTRICNPPACECKPGFYRNGKDCVDLSQCLAIQGKTTPPPLRCGTKERINLCGNQCEKSCEKAELVATCSKVCHPPACECKPGLYRLGDDCVMKNQCPSKTLKAIQPVLTCGTNEEVNNCGNRCEKTCDTLDQAVPCPLICDPPACQCKKGFARNGDECVHIAECPARSPIQPSPHQPGLVCGANEMVNTCGNQCEKKCETANKVVPCPLICAPPACECKGGFYRKGGDCVPIEQCPPLPPIVEDSPELQITSLPQSQWACSASESRDCFGGPKDPGAVCDPDPFCEKNPPSTQWYYNEDMNLCIAFNYSGCLGNANRFPTPRDCYRCLLTDSSCKGGPKYASYARTIKIEKPTPKLVEEEGGKRVEKEPFRGRSLCGKDVTCPDGFNCRNGAFSSVCCNATVDEIFSVIYRDRCPNGHFMYQYPSSGRGSPYFGESCSELPCPPGFQCSQHNSFFASCCAIDREFCPENEVFQECGPTEYRCEISCRNKNNPPVCEDSCGPPSCICKPGFVRGNAMTCVPEVSCQPPIRARLLPQSPPPPPTPEVTPSEAGMEEETPMGDDPRIRPPVPQESAEEVERKEMSAEDSSGCELPCQKDCYKVFHPDGCPHCHCPHRPQKVPNHLDSSLGSLESPCEETTCPAHCPMVEDDSGCFRCACSPGDSKETFWVRIPVTSGNHKDVAVCVDFPVSGTRQKLFTADGKSLRGEIVSVRRNQRRWVTLRNPSHNPFLASRTLPRCSCGESPIQLIHFKDPLPNTIRGGLIGKARSQIRKSQLEIGGFNGAHSLPETGTLFIRKNKRNQRVISTHLVTRVDGITQEIQQCYQVLYQSLVNSRSD